MSPEEFVFDPELSIGQIVEEIDSTLADLASDSVSTPERVSNDGPSYYSFYRWRINGAGAGQITVILEYGDLGQPELIDRSRMTVIAGQSIQGPSCEEIIQHKSHTRTHVSEMLRVLVRTACFGSTLYEEEGIKPSKDWNLTRS